MTTPPQPHPDPSPLDGFDWKAAIDRALAILGIVIAVAASWFAYRSNLAANNANRIARDANRLTQQQAIAHTVVLSTLAGETTAGKGEAACAFDVRLADLGSAGSSVVGFSAAISFLGSTKVVPSEQNFAQSIAGINGGPDYLQIFLTDLPPVGTPNLLNDALTNKLTGPVNIDPHSARDIDFYLAYSYDNNVWDFDDLFSLSGQRAPMAGYSVVGITVTFTFLDGSRSSTTPEVCLALGRR